MLLNNQNKQETVKLSSEHIQLATQIAHRLNRRYSWVGFDDLQSYAYMGILLAARLYDSSRGISFERFACVKALFLAIDEMRKDGILHRSETASKRPSEQMGVEVDMPDPSADRDAELLEARDLCSSLLDKLEPQERELLNYIYVEKETYREISSRFGISESAICLRHKAIIDRIRRLATVRKLAA